jgi:tape measure domain-containing protein
MSSLKIQKAISLAISADNTELVSDLRKAQRAMKSMHDPTKDLQRQFNALDEAAKQYGISAQAVAGAKNKLRANAEKQSEAIKKVNDNYSDEAKKQKEALAAREKVEARERKNAQKRADRATRRKKQEDDMNKEAQADLKRRLRVFKIQKKKEREAAEALKKRQEEEDKVYKQRGKEAAMAAKEQEEAARKAKEDAKNREIRQKKYKAQLRKDRQERKRQQEDDMNKEAQADLKRRLRVFKIQKKKEREAAEAIKKQQKEEDIAYKKRQKEIIQQKRLAAARKQAAHAAQIHVRAMRSMVGTLTTMVGPLVIAYKAWETFKKAIDLSSELQRSEAKFEVFLGDLQSAKNLLADIRDLSGRSPVSFQAGQRAVATMLQFGVASDGIMTRLEQIAEATGGNSERMESLALAYAQVTAAGRLMGQENIQLLNAGFSPLLLISEKTGESMTSLKKKMEDGAISAEMVTQILVESTSEGGKFFGLLDRTAAKPVGALMRLNNEFEKLLTNLGDATLSSFEGDIDKAATALQKFEQFSKNVERGWEKAKNNAFAPLSKALRLIEHRAETMQARFQWFFDLVTEEAPKAGAQMNFGKDMLKAEDIAKMTFKEKLDYEIKTLETMQKQDQLTEKAAKQLKEKKKLLEQIRQDEAAEQAQKNRLDKAFDDTGMFKDLIDATYDDKADVVKALRDQSVAGEREGLDKLIEAGVSFRAILASSNLAAQERAKEMMSMKETVRLAREKVEKEKEAKRIADEIVEKEKERLETVRKDLEEKASELNKGPFADFIEEMAQLKAMQQSGMISDAIFGQQRRKLLQDQRKDVQGGNAAPNVTKGSQEAYAALTQQTIDKQKRQIQIAEEQRMLSVTANDIAGRMEKILEDLKETKPVGHGP